MKRKAQNLKPVWLVSKTQNHPQATLILVAFVALAITYSLVVPPFEAGDESRHYAVIKYMVDTGRLPIQQPGEAQIHWSHEGNQPPLYYALAAALTFWIKTGSWDDVFWYNPHTTIGDPLRPDNKNITIHPPGERWPWRAHVLAVHLIRLLSIAMAAVTVTATYAIALYLFSGNRWLAAGAMVITAFNPMFIFISASINNDNAVIMFVTLTLWLMAKMASQPTNQLPNQPTNQPTNYPTNQLPNQPTIQPTNQPTTQPTHQPTNYPTYHPPNQLSNLLTAALLGLLIGLGALSKLYALGLLPLAGLLFLWLAYRERPTTNDQRPTTNHEQPSSSLPAPRSPFLTLHFWGNLLALTLTMLAVTLTVASWFYLRNAYLYDGDLLALQIMRDTAGQRQEAPSLATLRAEFKGFRIAYWALFGGVNLLVDDWIYTVLDWLSLLATLGVVAFIVSRFISPVLRGIHVSRFTLHIHLPTFTLLLAWYLIMLTGFILWNLTQPAGQGRLLYPAIAAISALGILGLTWWLPPWGQKVVVGFCTLGLFTFALLAPFLYIAPAYAKPPRLTQADLPSDMQPVNFTYNDQMRLIGYKLHADTVRPAESLPLTLYWELVQPVDLNYSIFVQLLGRQRQLVSQLNTYPGRGAWPTTLLAPGDILADRYEISIPPQAEFEHAPTQLLIATGIYDLQEPGRPGKPVTNAAGQTVEPFIGRVKLIPWQWPSPTQLETPINFFDKVTLLSHQIAADQQSVTLNWQVNQPFEVDYTVFIQAWQVDTNQYAAGFDGPPVSSDYPTTLWAPGEIIVDTHPLDLAVLPPGDYYLLAGLYHPPTGERLPAFGPDGPLPDYAVNLGTIQVTE